MKKNSKESVQEWFTKGDHDIESAQSLFERHGYTDIIAFLIQQAIEKYLKGYLIYHGWELKKIHDLQELVNEATKLDKSFAGFLDPCIRISKYYIDTRYPGFPTEYPQEEIKKSLNVAKKIIAKVKQAVK
ncbi:MAG: HEPN domain-containing protein [candidate division Zixibacteria bacterium]|nr:HEPN domain-containing protein [candidate division Zixibacteria bacterium]